MSKTSTLFYVINDLENCEDEMIKDQDLTNEMDGFELVYKLLDTFNPSPGEETMKRVFDYAEK